MWHSRGDGESGQRRFCSGNANYAGTLNHATIGIISSQRGCKHSYSLRLVLRDD